MEPHLDHVPAAACEAGVDLGKQMALAWLDTFFEAEISKATQGTQHAFFLVSTLALHDYFSIINSIKAALKFTIAFRKEGRNQIW